MKQIITGYKISGRTWISNAWNAGTLTREDIHDGIDSYSADDELPNEEEIRAIEEEYVLDEMDEDDTPADIKARLDECVENRMASMEREQDAESGVVDALTELYDNWTDDKDDEVQFALVHQAHTILDDYCRSIHYGEFDYPASEIGTTVSTVDEIREALSDERWGDSECDDPEISDTGKIRELILERSERLKHTQIYLPTQGEYVQGLRSEPIALGQYALGIEPVVDMRTICGARIKSLWLTVNPYNAVVLNSRNMLIADIDFYDKEYPKHGGVADENEVIAAMKTLRHLDDRPGASKHIIFSDESYRVYRTAKGCRVICTSRCFPWDRRAQLALMLMRYLQADPQYMSLCGIQRCYRARLTPKPWRCDDDDARVCSLIYEHGTKKVHVALADQLRVHDAMTLTGSGAYATLA